MDGPQKPNRLRLSTLSAILCLSAALVIWFTVQPLKTPPTAQDQPSLSSEPTNIQVTSITPPTDTSPSGSPALLPGEKILRDYAKPSLPAENDLTLVSRLMETFTLLVKSSASLPLSANEDWAAALRGSNPAHDRFLPSNHAIFNAQGQLVDRWRTPLFFHALGDRRFELRSAGPDGKMWTADDIHRNYDGSFRRGADLNAPSLMDAAVKSKR